MRAVRCFGLVAAVVGGLGAGDAAAQCGSGAIGTAREIPIDATGAPRFGQNQYPGPDLLRPGEVVLTFDDGPHKDLTPVILQILAQHCAKATFFMVGQRAMSYSGIVREVARQGHTIATHTWSHPNLRQLSQDGAVAEIELGISGVQKALGGPAAPFFRFPYLSDPSGAIAHLKSRNTAIFSIDVDSYDFRTRSPTVVLRNVMGQLKTKGRGIILFHDIQPSTAGALGALLSDLKAEGYRIVHLVPTRNQVTLAHFDTRVGTPQRNVAALPTRIDQRAVVAPAWEPRTIPVREMTPAGTPKVATVTVAPPRPPRPEREVESSDWKATIFRTW